MKNLFKAAALVLIAAFCLAGALACNNPEPQPSNPDANKIIELNVDEIASSIARNCSFEDQYLALVEDRDFSLQSFGIPAELVAGESGSKQAAIYVSASTPEMIVCIKAADESSVGQIEDAVKARINDYINNYTTYGPEQVQKLESAVSTVKGNYVVFAVTADNSAAADYISGILK